MDRVEVEGLTIAYERAGAGPALVLLHGFVGDSREWRRQVDALSDAFTVVAWDAPGAGRSSDPPESFRMPDYADCLALFVEALRLEHPNVVGLSFGGALALELYRRHPAVPSTLVIAGGYAGWPGSLPAEVWERRLAVSLQVSELPGDQFAEAMLPTLFSESAPADRVDEFAGIMSEFHPGGFRAMAWSTAETNLRDVLGRIEIPTLLVYGDADVRASPVVGEDLHAAIPGSKLTVLPAVGHMMNVEAAEQLNDEIRSFLLEVRG
ncbi:MAG: alpha/beta fold hydrolase [Actinomycetota bacterium]